MKIRSSSCHVTLNQFFLILRGLNSPPPTVGQECSQDSSDFIDLIVKRDHLCMNFPCFKLGLKWDHGMSAQD